MTRVVTVGGAGLVALAAYLGCNNSSTPSERAAPSAPTALGPAPARPASPAPQATQPPSTPAPSLTGQVGAAPPGTGSVAGLASLSEGSPVDITAQFFGWKGPCRDEPPTRSAWQLADQGTDGAACIYVDGPMPPGLGPAGGGGTPVRVRGTLVTYDGIRHVKAQSAEIVR